MGAGGRDIGARVEQCCEHRGVAVHRGEVQRRDPVTVGGTDFRTGGEERLDGREIVGAHRPMQRGRAIRAPGIDCRAAVERCCDRTAVSLLDELPQNLRVIGGVRGKRGEGGDEERCAAGFGGHFHGSPKGRGMVEFRLLRVKKAIL